MELRVRSATSSDLPEIEAIHAHHVRTSHAIFDLEPRGVEWRRRWFMERDAARHPVLVAIDDDAVVGFASAGAHRPKEAYASTVETTIHVAPGSVGRGVGSALYAELLAELDDVGVHRALAAIAVPNEPSVRLHERFGFRRVAHLSEVGWKFERYWDVDWYERAGSGSRHERT